MIGWIGFDPRGGRNRQVNRPIACCYRKSYEVQMAARELEMGEMLCGLFIVVAMYTISNIAQD